MSDGTRSATSSAAGAYAIASVAPGSYTVTAAATGYQTAAAGEDLLEIVVRRHEKASIILISNRPLEDRGTVLGDTAAVSAILDRFLHHAEVIRLEVRSYRMYDRREI